MTAGRSDYLNSALGGLGAGLGQMFFGNSGQDPFKQANKFFNKIPGAVQPYYQPYQQAGQNALGQLQGQFGNLVNDPNAMLNKIGAGYQKSPGYDWQLQQALGAGTNAAAAGGMAGSPQHQQQAMTTATGLANQDYYNYLNKALGLYGTGLQGLGGLNQMGYGANDQMANIMFNMLANQGALGYKNALAENQSQGSQWGNIAGSALQLLPYLI